jgi:hypothetical protein
MRERERGSYYYWNCNEAKKVGHKIRKCYIHRERRDPNVSVGRPGVAQEI